MESHCERWCALRLAANNGADAAEGAASSAPRAVAYGVARDGESNADVVVTRLISPWGGSQGEGRLQRCCSVPRGVRIAAVAPAPNGWPVVAVCTAANDCVEGATDSVQGHVFWRGARLSAAVELPTLTATNAAALSLHHGAAFATVLSGGTGAGCRGVVVMVAGDSDNADIRTLPFDVDPEDTTPIVQIDTTPVQADDSVAVVVATQLRTYIAAVGVAGGALAMISPFRPIGTKPRAAGVIGACFLTPEEGDEAAGPVVEYCALRGKGRIFVGAAEDPFAVAATVKVPSEASTGLVFRCDAAPSSAAASAAAPTTGEDDADEGCGRCVVVVGAVDGDPNAAVVIDVDDAVLLPIADDGTNEGNPSGQLSTSAPIVAATQTPCGVLLLAADGEWRHVAVAPLPAAIAAAIAAEAKAAEEAARLAEAARVAAEEAEARRVAEAAALAEQLAEHAQQRDDTVTAEADARVSVAADEGGAWTTLQNEATAESDRAREATMARERAEAEARDRAAQAEADERAANAARATLQADEMSGRRSIKADEASSRATLQRSCALLADEIVGRSGIDAEQGRVRGALLADGRVQADAIDADARAGFMRAESQGRALIDEAHSTAWGHIAEDFDATRAIALAEDRGRSDVAADERRAFEVMLADGQQHAADIDAAARDAVAQGERALRGDVSDDEAAARARLESDYTAATAFWTDALSARTALVASEAPARSAVTNDERAARRDHQLNFHDATRQRMAAVFAAQRAAVLAEAMAARRPTEEEEHAFRTDTARSESQAHGVIAAAEEAALMAAQQRAAEERAALRNSFFTDPTAVSESHRRFFMRFTDRVLNLLEASTDEALAACSTAAERRQVVADLREFASDVVPAVRQAELERAQPRGNRREGYQLFWQEEWVERVAVVVVRSVRCMVGEHLRHAPGAIAAGTCDRSDYELSIDVSLALKGLGSLLPSADGVVSEATAEATGGGAGTGLPTFAQAIGSGAGDGAVHVTAYDVSALQAVSALRTIHAGPEHIRGCCEALMSWTRTEPDDGAEDHSGLTRCFAVVRLREQLAYDCAALALEGGKFPAVLTAENVDRWLKRGNHHRTQATELEMAILSGAPSVTRLLGTAAALPTALAYLPYVIAALPSKAIHAALAHFPAVTGTFFEWACSPKVQRLAAKVLKTLNPKFDLAAVASTSDAVVSAIAADYYMLLVELEGERAFQHPGATAAALRFFAVQRRSLLRPGALDAQRDRDAAIRQLRSLGDLARRTVANGRVALGGGTGDAEAERYVLSALLVVDGENSCPDLIQRCGLTRRAIDHAIATSRLDTLYPLLADSRTNVAVDPSAGWEPMHADDVAYLLRRSHDAQMLFPAAMLTLQAFGDDTARLRSLLCLAFPDSTEATGMGAAAAADDDGAASAAPDDAQIHAVVGALEQLAAMTPVASAAVPSGRGGIQQQ